MREYKFRGKAKYNEKRHKINEWIFGDLRINSKGQTFICERQTLLETEVKPETVGQYTGLHDKSGKKIFEGDIILTQPFRDKPYSKKYKEKRLKGVVKYNIKCGDDFCGCEGKMKYWGAEWNVEIIDKEDYKKFSNYDWGRFFECEVIGNIYDNPELLEEGEER